MTATIPASPIMPAILRGFVFDRVYISELSDISQLDFKAILVDKKTGETIKEFAVFKDNDLKLYRVYLRETETELLEPKTYTYILHSVIPKAVWIKTDIQVV